MKIEQLALYEIPDRSWLNGKSLADAVGKALKGGATMVQLREKGVSEEALIQSAVEIKAVCAKYGAPLIINDNVFAAARADADGVHLGQGDMPLIEARKLLGKNKIIGITAKTVEQAIEAEKGGADYLGSGAVFGTSTKSDAKKMELDTLRAITSAVNIPVVGIGGITADNIAGLDGTGIAGAAVVSGIFAQTDICAAAKRLREEIEKITED